MPIFIQSIFIFCHKICLALLLLLAVHFPHSGQTQPIISYDSRFHPEFARHGMVVAQEALAAKVGRDILQKGGNAVDAAIATNFALAVTLPRAGNLGGGGFMMIYLADTDQSIALDYREKAPLKAHRDMFLDATGKPDNNKSRFSGAAIGVPGSVAGMALAHKRYGSGKFTLAELIAPAVKLAHDGFPVSVDLHWSLQRAQKRLYKDEQVRQIFYANGHPPAIGSLLQQRDLAKSLKHIAKNGADGFYHGYIAQALVDTIDNAGGLMQMTDLANYQPVVRTPVIGSYRGYKIASMPLPSSGGLHIIQILNMLEPYNLKKSGFGTAKTIHLMAEAMRRAYADRSHFPGDSDFVSVPTASLQNKKYAQKRMENFSPAHASPSEEIAPGKPKDTESNETTHFSVVDAQGNAVSNTTTLNFSYGAGIIAKGTGIFLNNEMDDFSAKPGSANAYGLIGSNANAVAPNKRPLSSMSPTLVFKNRQLWLVTGTPGGSRIISTVVQIIINSIDHDMNIAEATAAPRMHHQWQPDELRIEGGFSLDSLNLLRAMGHKISQKYAMGSTQSIMILPTENGGHILAGATDTRKPASAVAGY